MGKGEEQNLPQQQRREVADRTDSSGFLCGQCSIALRRVSKEFNFKCVLFLILGFAVFVPGILWILPLHARNPGFEAKDAIKLSATVQVYFILEKPVKELLPYMERLEFDINGELDVPDVKVSILSMHEIGESNRTYVVFGLLSEFIYVPIKPVALSLLRSCLYELFLRESNFTLTTSIFGQPSTFEILKFPGGISIIPFQHASIWQFPQIVFNFTLTNSISEVLDNFVEFKNELRLGLRLRPHENVYLQITNEIGSTIQPLVVIQASISSELGRLTRRRLHQLAAIINASPESNLGLDNSIFGEIKSISLSSTMKGTHNAMPPTLSPAPAPSPGDRRPSRSSYGPMPPSGNHFPPCENSSPAPPVDSEHSSHGHAIAPSSYPKSTRLVVPPADQPRVSDPRASPIVSTPLLPPDLLPVPNPYFGFEPGRTYEKHRIPPFRSSHPDHD